MPSAGVALLFLGSHPPPPFLLPPFYEAKVETLCHLLSLNSQLFRIPPIPMRLKAPILNPAFVSILSPRSFLFNPIDQSVTNEEFYSPFILLCWYIPVQVLLLVTQDTQHSRIQRETFCLCYSQIKNYFRHFFFHCVIKLMNLKRVVLLYFCRIFRSSFYLLISFICWKELEL